MATAMLAAVLGSGSVRAVAQEVHRPTFSATIALGTGSMGLSGLVSGAVRSAHWQVALRTTGNLPPAGRAVAGELALLGGYVIQRPHALYALGTGVALVETGDSSRTYAAPFNAHTQIGLPLQASALWRPSEGLGLGLIGVANLNARHSFCSLLVGLQLGRFD